MGIKKQVFNQVVGMNHDLAPSKRDGKYAYEIKNMRITIEENNTLMAWTNEKGTKEIKLYEEGGPIQYLIGHIMGECVLNNYWVLFSYVSVGDNIIYRLDFSNPDRVNCVLLFRGNLNMSLGNKMETLGIYENTDIQKVYWIDGVNQPRFINIVSNSIDANDTTLFDFLPTDNNITHINIKKQTSSGQFKAGTIQYMFTYYNNNGALSNIFYTSPVQYVSSTDIGVETDKPAHCSFNIEISNINTNFDFIRVYSVFRASEDTSPLASIVKDIDITKINNTSNIITIHDEGDNNTAMNYSDLLFLNRIALSPKTMDQKDNTLFLGNYQYLGNDDKQLKSILKGISVDDISFTQDIISEDANNQFYPYTNQLNKGSLDILGFKAGETYLFGYMLQDKHDRWTSVIPLGIKTVTEVHPQVVKKKDNNNIWQTKRVVADLSKVIGSIYKQVKDEELKYKAIKFVIATKTEALRNIICQGIVCPTVYSYENRVNGTAPFVLSSWFFRPLLNDSLYKVNQRVNDYETYEGLFLEYRHLSPLPHLSVKSYENRAVEIQCNDDDITFEENGLRCKKLVNIGLADSAKNARNLFGIDQSILTFHSPDIEFNSAVLGVLDRSSDYKCNLVGYTCVKNTASDYDVEVTNTSFMEVDYNRYIYKTILGLNKLPILIDNGALSLVNPWGVRTDEYDTDAKDFEGEGSKLGYFSYCLIFPWQRSTSLNEQPYKYSKKEKTLDWTVPLKTKVFSHLRVCAETDYFREPINYAITNINISDPTSKLIKIKGTGYVEEDEVTYYGNIDSLITKENYRNFRWWKGEEKYTGSGVLYDSTAFQPASMNLKSDKDLNNKMSDPIRMKYSSSTHAVFGFKIIGYEQRVLPVINSTDGKSNYSYSADGLTFKTWRQQADSSNGISYTDEAWDRTSYVVKTIFLTSEESGFDPRTTTETFELYINRVLALKDLLNAKAALYAPTDTTSVYLLFITGSLEDIINVRSFQRGTWAMFRLYKNDEDKTVIEDYTSKVGLASLWRDQWNIVYEKVAGLYDLQVKSYDSSGKDNPSIGDGTEKGEGDGDNSLGGGGNGTASSDSVRDPYNDEAIPGGGHSDYNTDLKGYGDPEKDDSKKPLKAPTQSTTYTVVLETRNIYKQNAFFIAEFVRNNPYQYSMDDYNLLNYNWQAASDIIPLNSSGNCLGFGDTYFQRYDCLKTFPSTPDDPNQIVDIGSFMLETYINIDGRWDRNRGLLNNNDITNTNFNLINKAYTLKDKFVQHYIGDLQFAIRHHPNSVMWTLTKIFGEPIDSWTHLTSTSILDLDGDEGWLEKILNFQNSLLFFQADGVGLIRYNENVLISTNSGVPVELANSGKVDGKVYYNKEIGCQNKDTIAVSKNAVYFIDGHTKTIYQIKQPQGLLAPTALSDGTFETFMKEQNIDIEKSFYNRNTLDIYFTFPNNSAYSCLTYNELMQGFTSFYDYKAPFINNIINSCYHVTNEVDPNNGARRAFIWKQNAGMYNYYYAHKVEEDFNNPDDDWYGGLYGPFYMTVVANGEQNDSLVDKIYDNLEFRSDSWDIQGNLLPTTFNKLNTWNEYQAGSNTLTRYGVWTNPDNTTKVSIDNPSTLKKKFRIWRANFPRAGYWRSDDKARPVKPVTLPSETVDIPGFRAPTYIIKRTRDRIRNPWTYVQLLMSTPNHDKTTLHDMTVLYFDNSGVR